MSKKIRRNDPCPCGSGIKYKKCCGNVQNTKYPLHNNIETTLEPCTLSLSAIERVSNDELVIKKMLRNVELVEKGHTPNELEINITIEELEKIFLEYDKIQLLGALGLHLIYVEFIRKQDLIDEEIETILEYAMSFAFACDGNSSLQPTDEVIRNMYTKLLFLKRNYNYKELLYSLQQKSSRDLLNHLDFINVRGDGYPTHIEEVFNEYFSQHDAFISNHYFGATLSTICRVLHRVDERIICRLYDSSAHGVKGAYSIYNYWLLWYEQHKDDCLENIPEGYNPIMGGFLRDNPEIPRTSTGEVLLHNFQSYEQANLIFRIIPKNEGEKALLDVWSSQFGDNEGFMQGDYKGSILNFTTNVRQKPFLKYNNEYYCFSVLLPHRRMFELASNLLKIDNQYYQNHYLGNSYPECRDNYVERKVYELFSRSFLNIKFYSSVHYLGKDGEMDIIGVSDNAIYLIEVKAYQLTDTYRGGTIGIENKLKESVGVASRQCQRSEDYIKTSTNPVFTSNQATIDIPDKTLPIYKICITLEHYGGLTCNMRNLVEMNVINEDERNIWIVSLYDLMAVLDSINDETKLIEYLTLHNQITTSNDAIYNDEIDLLGTFLTNPSFLSERTLILTSGSETVDKIYQSSI